MLALIITAEAGDSLRCCWEETVYHLDASYPILNNYEILLQVGLVLVSQSKRSGFGVKSESAAQLHILRMDACELGPVI